MRPQRIPSRSGRRSGWSQAAPPQRGVPASYIAVLSDPKTNRPVLVATAERRAMVLRVSTLDPAIHVAGRSLELWALRSGGTPRSR